MRSPSSSIPVCPAASPNATDAATSGPNEVLTRVASPGIPPAPGGPGATAGWSNTGAGNRLRPNGQELLCNNLRVRVYIRLHLAVSCWPLGSPGSGPRTASRTLVGKSCSANPDFAEGVDALDDPRNPGGRKCAPHQETAANSVAPRERARRSPPEPTRGTERRRRRGRRPAKTVQPA